MNCDLLLEVEAKNLIVDINYQWTYPNRVNNSRNYKDSKRNLIPVRYPWQYEDEETGLYYNRCSVFKRKLTMLEDAGYKRKGNMMIHPSNQGKPKIRCG